MRYLAAIAVAMLIVALGGLVLQQLTPMTWPAHAATVATLVAAALAARRVLKRQQ